MTGTGVLDAINHKRGGGQLSAGQIEAAVHGYLTDAVPDYQMAALLMAIACRGMTSSETVALTQTLAGPTRLRLGDERFVADKHSTGGVGDKTTLVLAPLLAAVGVPVAKMSGRGLEHAGGTIDKLEAITGLRLPGTAAQMRAALAATGFAITGQTGDLAPGDGALYRLRDVTGTVESIPLIAASIMSKKIAAGASALVLDVKTGSGALTASPDDALHLAKLMVDIGTGAGLPTRAVVSAMDQPLGHAVGNALEVAEAIAALRGEPVPGLVPLTLHLAGLLAQQAWPNRSPEDIHQELTGTLHDGRAFTALRRWVAHHGGDTTQIDHPDRLPQAARIETVTAPVGGWIARIDAATLGRTCQLLGAGRTRLDQPINHAVGLRLRIGVGRQIGAGAPLLDLHLPADADADHITGQVLAAITVTDTAVPQPPLILHTL
ncbi:thymidine phosphorylase [Micromonospora sp. DT4]|uniref:thymidine phosphorylase n=1 Tax=Micromonospora sp. DT4 TaxID=3393438 RepID=UPI003CEAC04E